MNDTFDKAVLRSFFEDYSKASLGNDPKSIAAFYASDFIVGDPEGFLANKNDNAFLTWLQGVIEFNKKSGMQEMRVDHIDLSPIGTNYVTVRVTWGAIFSSHPDQVITFDITYTLFKVSDNYKILMYLSHEIQEETMKQHGLL
jgi:hypothetical protein